MPFGASRAVHAFLRISHSIWWLGARALSLVWTNFFDDFITFCRSPEAVSTSQCVESLFCLLGWGYADSGEKAGRFDTCFQALGIQVDLSAFRKGVIFSIVQLNARLSFVEK